LCEWALPEEDYEICQTLKEIKANNIDTFKIRFIFEGENNNKASVVKFVDKDGQIYPHADYLLHDDVENSIIRLHKDSEGLWASAWKSNESKLFDPIGEAIDAREEKPLQSDFVYNAHNIGLALWKLNNQGISPQHQVLALVRHPIDILITFKKISKFKSIIKNYEKY
jgi:hypothetical protein